MKSIKLLLASVTAMVVAAGFAISAQATQISGDIDFAGQVTYNSTLLGSATMVTAWNMATVSGATGDFAPTLGSTPAFATPYVFNPPTPYATLWSVGGFTFELDNSQVIFQDNFLLSIRGSGFVSGPGFDKTPGLWSFSSNHSNGKSSESFNFSANTTAVPTPDSGSTVALLGVAIFTVGALRAKFRS
jgi:hypothetical protein